MRLPTLGSISRVPIFGLAGTLHEEIYTARGLEFRAEFFADLDYDELGNLLITREHDVVPPRVAADRAIRAVTEGLASSIAGVDIMVRAETICVHSDTPNAVAIVRAVREALSPYISTHSSPRCE